jgi:hypothetical protein
VPTLWGGGPGARPEGVPLLKNSQAKELCAGSPRRSWLFQRIMKVRHGISGRSPIGISSDRSLPYKQTNKHGCYVWPTALAVSNIAFTSGVTYTELHS